MSPETDNFQKKLDDLHTALLGIPGTADKGFIGEVKDLLKEHDSRLDEHDEYIQEQKGAGRLIAHVYTAAIAIVVVVLDHLGFRNK